MTPLADSIACGTPYIGINSSRRAFTTPPVSALLAGKVSAQPDIAIYYHQKMFAPRIGVMSQSPFAVSEEGGRSMVAILTLRSV